MESTLDQVMDNRTYTVTFHQGPARKKFGFSKTELEQLGASMLVLTLAFAIILSDGIQYIDLGTFPYLLAISALAVATAFLLHELAHKFVAQKYGCWAEFRYWPFGLLIALVSSMVGFLFAAPGAVMIGGDLTEEKNGKISAAGPLANISVAGIFTVFWIMSPDIFLSSVARYVAFINAFIGGFNLIPMLPFDGAKILSWSLPVYIAMVIPTALLVALFMGIITF